MANSTIKQEHVSRGSALLPASLPGRRLGPRQLPIGHHIRLDAREPSGDGRIDECSVYGFLPVSDQSCALHERGHLRFINSLDRSIPGCIAFGILGLFIGYGGIYVMGRGIDTEWRIRIRCELRET